MTSRDLQNYIRFERLQRSNSAKMASETGHGAAGDHVWNRTLATDPTECALVCHDKGEFLLGNRKYRYPLTITDFASRYLLTCEALLTTQEKFAFTVFERTFKELGFRRSFAPITASRCVRAREHSRVTTL